MEISFVWLQNALHYVGKEWYVYMEITILFVGYL